MPISIVMNCDCMDFMATCKDKQFSLAIVDPPYGIGVDEKNLVKNNSDRFQDKAKRSHEWDNFVPDEIYFNELFRISKEQIIWGGQLFP
jgi:site-specific DNA-methyltransferase (adenine-specific)